MTTRDEAELNTSPYWADSVSMPPFAKLDDDLQVDVVVIGGGITGLTAAYLLTAAGKTVAVLERGRLAQVDTGHTTRAPHDGHRRAARRRWCSASGATTPRPSGTPGLPPSRRSTTPSARIGSTAGSSGSMAISTRRAGDDRSSRRPTLREEAELAAELGFDASFVDGAAGRGPRHPNRGQARVHPRKYLAGLAQPVVRRRPDLRAQRRRRVLRRAAVRDGQRPHRRLRRHRHRHAQPHRRARQPGVGATLLQTKLALYTSYVVAGRVPRRAGCPTRSSGTPRAVSLPAARAARRDHDLVIFGGEDHKTGQVADTAALLPRLEQR